MAATPDEVAAELRRAIAAKLGEARLAELAPEIAATAKALALVLAEPIDLAGEDPDFVRPLA